MLETASSRPQDFSLHCWCDPRQEVQSQVGVKSTNFTHVLCTLQQRIFPLHALRLPLVLFARSSAWVTASVGECLYSSRNERISAGLNTSSGTLAAKSPASWSLTSSWTLLLGECWFSFNYFSGECFPSDSLRGHEPAASSSPPDAARLPARSDGERPSHVSLCTCDQCSRAIVKNTSSVRLAVCVVWTASWLSAPLVYVPS